MNDTTPISPQTPAGEPRAAKLFTVPEGVKYLDANQMAALTDAFRAWSAEARGSRTRRARLRVLLVYLLLRYSGARLGEVLALDDTRDLDYERLLVRFRAGSHEEDREVALPPFLVEELEQLLEDPLLARLRGEVFQLDQGYVRRKFYEQAERSELPRELLTPRALRHSRAVELLRQGVPLPAMQAVLGHSSLHGASSYYSLSDDDLRRIVQHYVQGETRMKTSARNTFAGRVTAVRAGTILSEVEVTTARGASIVCIITNESISRLVIQPGRTVTAVVKAPLVFLTSDHEATSARNSFKGRITRINQGAITAEVIGVIEDSTILCALISTESLQRLGLEVGREIWFQFEAFSVILNVE